MGVQQRATGDLRGGGHLGAGNGEGGGRIAEVLRGVGEVVGASTDHDQQFTAAGEGDSVVLHADPAGGTDRCHGRGVAKVVAQRPAERQPALVPGRGLLVRAGQGDRAGVGAVTGEPDDDHIVRVAGVDLAAIPDAAVSIARRHHAVAQVELAAVVAHRLARVAGQCDTELGQQPEASEVIGAVGELAVVGQLVVTAAGPEGAVGEVEVVVHRIAPGQRAEPAIADGQGLLHDARLNCGRGVPDCRGLALRYEVHAGGANGGGMGREWAESTGEGETAARGCSGDAEKIATRRSGHSWVPSNGLHAECRRQLFIKYEERVKG